MDNPISFTVVEAPMEQEAFWPFGPTHEPVDTSGLFESFGGVSGEDTDDSLFMVEEEPAQQLGFREHIVGGLTAMARAMMVAIFHYLWLSFGNSLYARMIKNTYGQHKVFWGQHQYGRRVGSHDRSHREAADRLQQRLRKCADGQWPIGGLFRRRHHTRNSGQTGSVQSLGRATKKLNRRRGGE